MARGSRDGGGGGTVRNVAYLMFGLVMLVFGFSLAGPRAGNGGGGMQEMKVEELVTRLGANLAAQKAKVDAMGAVKERLLASQSSVAALEKKLASAQQELAAAKQGSAAAAAAAAAGSAPAQSGGTSAAGAAGAGAAAEVGTGSLSPVYPPVKGAQKPTPRYTSSHCIGQTFREEEWQAKSCYLRDLCFDSASNSFKYYASDADPATAEGWEKQRLSTHVDESEPARGPMRTNLKMSLSPLNVVWQPQFEGGFPWSPEVVRAPIPADAVWDTSAEVFVLYMSYNSHNVGHLIFDELFPWFNLASMFNLLGTDMQALNFKNFNPKYPHHDPKLSSATPTNSCERYAEALRTGISYRFETPNAPLPDDERKNAQNIIRVCNKLRTKLAPMMSKHLIRTFPDYEEHPELKGKVTCFPRLLTGVGMLAEHCGDESRHGDLPEHNENWGWARSFCNPGRSSNFWAFRQYILSRQLHVSTSLAPCRLAQRKPVVFVAIRALDDKFEGPGVERWEAGGAKLQKLLGDSATVEAKVISTFTIREQAVFMAKTNVLVQLSGGGSSTMLFLPRGATTVLLAPRSTKDDFVLWGHTAWLRITWVEIKELNDPLDTAVIAPLVTEGLAHYERFSECSDV